MRRKEGNFSQNNNYGVAEKPTYLLILKQELTKIRETRQDVILPLTKHQTNSLQRHANKKGSILVTPLSACKSQFNPQV